MEIKVFFSLINQSGYIGFGSPPEATHGLPRLRRAEPQLVLTMTKAVTCHTGFSLVAKLGVGCLESISSWRDKIDQSRNCNFFLKKTSKISLELSTPPGCAFCFFSKRNVVKLQCLGAMTGLQRRVPCVPAAQKLCGDKNSSRFVLLVISLFSPCFFGVYLFCLRENKCCFFLLLFLAAIFAVFVCPLWSFSSSNYPAVFALTGCKYNFFVSVFSPCVFLACLIFFNAIIELFTFLGIFLHRCLLFVWLVISGFALSCLPFF